MERFLIRERRQRLQAHLRTERGRSTLRLRLAQFSDLDQRWCEQVPPAPAAAERAWILDALRSAGAPQRCYLICEDADLDGRDIALADALHHTLLEGYVGLASCVPGELGFYVGDAPGVRWLLRRER